MIQHRYSVTGAISPDLPLRVLDLFAQRSLVIDSAQVARHGDAFHIDVVATGLAEHPARIIAEKLRSMVLVTAVHHQNHELAAAQ